jgi:imidazole glycerol-phosphate synthase subunit HisH
MKKALIVNYGVGNVHSVSSFLRNFGFHVNLSNNPSEILECDLAALPGVGSFGPAKQKLDYSGASEAIVARSLLKRPILGICLGFQLLTQNSDESIGTAGLSIINAKTRKLAKGPVIGWQETKFLNHKSESLNSFYFNHSYGVFGQPEADDYSLAGAESYISYFQKDSVLGVQFHPEKSQKAGMDFFSGMLESEWFANS